MPDPTDVPVDAYVAERARQALATDPRVSDLDVTVTLVRDGAFVRGSATSPEQVEAIGEVLAEQLPERRVTNEVHVVAVDEPAGAEELA